MKLKIEKPFKDKYTGEMYEAGKEVDFEDDRAEEILSDSRGLVAKVKEAKKPARKSKK